MGKGTISLYPKGNPSMSETPAKAAPAGKTDGGANESTFNTMLERFKSHTASAMEAALALSHMAIQQFAQHGNLSYAQKFLDAMPLNYARKGAFVEWLRDHSPLKVEGTLKAGYTLSKDKSPEANPFRVEVALATPFWEYMPEKETINFDEKDIVKAIKSTINKYRGNRYHASTDRAVFALTQADMVCRYLENAINSGKPISVTETANDTHMAVKAA